MNIPHGRVTALLFSLSLLLFAIPAQAQVVISQVYGGGGNSGATLKHDFIELRNNGTSTVSVDGWSVQYTSATGATWNLTPLSGSIAPGSYYLIQQAQGAGGTQDLPTPDATGTLAMSGTAGKVALSRSGTALSGACPRQDANVVDFVGFGKTANCFEGSAPTAAPSNSTAVLRNGQGSVDTQDNAADFSVATPNPRNSGTAPPATALARSIAQIQGNGRVSPYAQQQVITEGVVTAVKYNNGFFIQSSNDDGDPATSEGLFVFTSSAPPAAAAVGNRVRVTGTVAEFVPASNPHQLSITQITAPSVELLDTGVPLPAPVVLTEAELGAAALPDTLERLEGMRVSIAHAVAVAPSGGTINEANATASNDGVFHVTLPGLARPFREPGIGMLDVFPIPGDKQPPRFDTNPERLMVRSRGQVGASPLLVNTGAQVTGLSGVLDYFSGTWALLPDPSTPPTVNGGMAPRAVPDARYDEATVATFNLQRLFDEVADGNGAVTLTPAALDKRLNKAALAICQFLKTPDIVGVVEAENLRVLQMLSDRIDTTCPQRPGYVPYLQSGNDVGGINVGFLVSTRATANGTPRVQVVDVAQFGKNTTMTNPNGSTSLLNDRPPLRLRARIHQDGASYPLTVIVNHLRSLNNMDDTSAGSNGWATGGDRVRSKRAAQAAYLGGLVQQMQQTDPNEKIILVGDFNAFEFNDGYVDVLGIIRGDAAPANRVLHWAASPVTTPLIDGSQLIADPQQRYSYVYGGNAQTLDHVLVNEALVLDTDVQVDHARINADFGVVNYGDASVALRTSDHDPVRLRIRIPAFARADLSATVNADRTQAQVGDTVAFTATVSNAGPGTATGTTVAFVFSAALTPVMTTTAPGWSCQAPVLAAGNTQVSCTHANLTAGAEANFAFQAVIPASLAGTTLGLGVSVNSSLPDPANADNTASVAVPVAALPVTPVAKADLSVDLQSSALGFRPGTLATLLVPVNNVGPDTAEGVKVQLGSNIQARYLLLSTPRGWSCSQVLDTRTGSGAQCTRDSPMPAGTTQTLAFVLRVPASPKRGALYAFTAQVSSDTADPDTSNNQAQLIR